MCIRKNRGLWGNINDLVSIHQELGELGQISPPLLWIDFSSVQLRGCYFIVVKIDQCINNRIVNKVMCQLKM